MMFENCRLRRSMCFKCFAASGKIKNHLDPSSFINGPSMPTSNVLKNLKVHPLTPERWRDFEQLFGKNGACGGCWCMLWRLTRKEFDAQKGDANRQAMRALVEGGTVPGLLAYAGAEPVGWCALAPRADYPALARSRTLKPVDDRPCWSVACLFIHKAYRKQGVSTALLKAAVKFVRKQGGSILEGYPVEPKKEEIPAVFAWTGIPAAFERAGFKEVARHSPTRPIMRIEV
jgi:GNAT superfamily N-acetyltransferase